jgi:hypothetical protein
MKVHLNLLNVDPIHHLEPKKNLLQLEPLNLVRHLRSRSFARPILRSAVPDSQLLSLARRPVQPGNGRKINSIFILIFLTCFSWSTS